MSMTRREFVGRTAAGAAAAAMMGAGGVTASAARAEPAPATSPAPSQRGAKITCVAFDAFPIFDPRPIAALAGQLLPGKGADLMTLWRTRQFEYTWLRTAGGRYVDFWKTTEDALLYAAKTLKLDLTDAARGQLMRAYLELKVYPDVKPALTALRAAGLRLAFVSNFSPAMLDANLRGNSLGGDLFEHVLSTDAAKAFKPAPASYQLAVDAFKVPAAQILFVPFAAWDAAGAKWFGHRTFWVNRQRQPAEELDAAADGVGESLDDLVRYLRA